MVPGRLYNYLLSTGDEFFSDNTKARFCFAPAVLWSNPRKTNLAISRKCYGYSMIKGAVLKGKIWIKKITL